jgi:nucleoside-triphosphatase
MNEKKNILITGQPGIGKTTFIRKLAEKLKDLHPSGFYTTEIRKAGIREGFELISFDGTKGILSHVDIKSPYRVSKYGVDVERFENFLDSISLLDLTMSVVVIDEIGKMECFSDKFRSLVKDILNSDKLLVATIVLKGSGMIADIKKRDDVKLFQVKLENRDSLVSEILNNIRDLGKDYISFSG